MVSFAPHFAVDGFYDSGNTSWVPDLLRDARQYETQDEKDHARPHDDHEQGLGQGALDLAHQLGTVFPRQFLLGIGRNR
jgi:hypothetical protein